jgi:hypothetical protein
MQAMCIREVRCHGFFLHHTTPMARLTKQHRFAIVFLIVAAVTGYWWYTYQGVFKWIAELQVWLLGEYELHITVLSTAFVVMLVVARVTEIPWIKRRFDLGPMSEEEQAQAGRLFDENTVIPWWPLVIATGCLVPGLIMSIQVWTMGSLTAIDAAELESGIAPRSGWVDATGRVMGSLTISLSEGTPKKTKNAYVPMVSKDWQLGMPVSVYVELDGESMVSDVEITMRGRVAWSGLPGVIREAFARSDAPPAPGHIVVEHSFKPDFSRGFGMVLLVVAGIMYGVALVLFLLYRSANKRAGWA